MTPAEFIAKWKRVTLSERSACQQHFLDLCEVLNQPKPAAADPDGAFYTFERGLKKDSGGQGWADVWFRNHFAWEYKGKHKDLAKAYEQLQQYREALENPPLLVVCDMDRFEVHTNFTGTVKKVHEFKLDNLAEVHHLDILRKLFTDPEDLRPQQTTITVTELAAYQYAKLADDMRRRGLEATHVAHFLMKLMFCMFAEDIDLLPKKLFERTVEASKGDPKKLTKMLRSLFAAMAKGDYFGADEILFFNGGLFADAEAVELRPLEIEAVLSAARFDWASVEPSIFGTLFERLLDPDKRSQLGAHYTSREDIETLTRPVVMTPLRREWDAVRAQADKLREKVRKEAAERAQARSTKTRKKSARADLDKLLNDFIERLAHVTILDPACGSGNFLYVAIRMLLDLEKEVLTYAATTQSTVRPHVRPTQLSGLEINQYAQELAQVVIWIGYLQWKHDNGYDFNRHPVLDNIESIHRTDAILDLSDPENPKELEWPDAEFIIGNPPFLGGKRIRGECGHDYYENMLRVFKKTIPPFSDLCCYWFEKARRQIELGKTKRAGLLATQGIRGGANRIVLDRVKQSGDIFFAVSDLDWILDGANVHVSMIGFDNGDEQTKQLDNATTDTINADLTSAADTTIAQRLKQNESRSFVGIQKSGPFDLSFLEAVEMAQVPNAHGVCNSDVLRPYLNALDIVRRPQDVWVIDFGEMTQDDSSRYEAPFEFVKKNVKPIRDVIRRERHRDEWWLYGETRQGMRKATHGFNRAIVTPLVAKHFVVTWQDSAAIASNLLIVIASQEDSDLGILSSSIHQHWARTMGTQLRESESGSRYTPTTCFETFPFPHPTPKQREAIAAAAKSLDELRSTWLNPPEWTKIETLEFAGSADGPWARYVHDPDKRGIGTVRYPRRIPTDSGAAKLLAKRTLTNLYNAKPEWLNQAHAKLDAAVFAAYGWDAGMSDDDLLAALLKLNLEREPAKRKASVGA